MAMEGDFDSLASDSSDSPLDSCSEEKRDEQRGGSFSLHHTPVSGDQEVTGVKNSRPRRHLLPSLTKAAAQKESTRLTNLLYVVLIL